MHDNTPCFEQWEIPDTSLFRTAGTRWDILADMFHAGVKEAEAKNFGWEMIVLGNTMTLIASLWRALRCQAANLMRSEVYLFASAAVAPQGVSRWHLFHYLL